MATPCLQHTSPPCLSPVPGVYSNSCLLHLLPTSIFPRIRVFSNESVLHIRWPKYWSFSFSISLSSEYSAQLSHPYVTTGETITLTRWTFVGKVTSLLFNKQSRLVIAFLPRSKHLLISWLQSPSAVILEPPKQRQPLFPLFPHLFPMK